MLLCSIFVAFAEDITILQSKIFSVLQFVIKQVKVSVEVTGCSSHTVILDCKVVVLVVIFEKCIVMLPLPL